MMAYGKPEVRFSDDIESYGDKELTMKEVIIRHIKKISDISCQEFTPGYWQEKPMKVGGGVVVTKEYRQDMRQAFCNAVDFLVAILYPDSDSTFKEIIDKLDASEIEIDLEHSDYTEKKLKIRKKLFKDINKMFWRTDYFTKSDNYTETSG